MKDVLKICVVSVGLVFGSHLDVSAETLSPERIQSELIGQDLQGRMGLLRASLRYNTNGTIEMRSFVGTGGGTWELSDTGMCVDITSGPRQGEECLTFTDNGDGTYDVSNGMTLVKP